MEKYKKLSPKAKTSWFIARILITLILFIISLASYLLFRKDLSPVVLKISLIISSITLILSLLNSLIYPWYEYKQWKYIITEDDIRFSEGIFFTKNFIIPIIRLQEINLNQGPINKKLNLYDVLISTSNISHKIPNLEMDEALKISEFLSKKIKDKVNKEILEEINSKETLVSLDGIGE
ncbi:MAG: PH domain-containing protein [Clostridiales bacterium]|nr:PH domain-containing protein [Clostridiales bacterium]